MPSNTTSSVFFYVYILESLKDFKRYIGYTNNLKRRLEEHKKGTLLKEFYAYSTRFRGGINVSGGDVDADGLDDITIMPQSKGTPNARVIRGISLK